MTTKHIIRRRRTRISYTDGLIVAIVLAIFANRHYHIHPAIALMVGIATYVLSIFLFFSSKFFRYSFAIFFSSFWGAVAYLIGEFVEKSSDTTACVFGILGFSFSLLAHKDEFIFEKGASRYQYEAL